MASHSSIPSGALPALVTYVILLTMIPSQLVVGPLGAAGTPAGILAIGLLVWWAASLAVPQVRRGTGAVPWLLAAFALTYLVSYAVGIARPLDSSLQVNSADRAVLSLCGWCGITLIVTYGLDGAAALNRLVKMVVIGVSVVAVLGMLQFFFNLDLAALIKIPGLRANAAFGEVISRSDFRRVTGTTTHPIEFGIVLSAALPLCVHHARFAVRGWGRTLSWSAVMVIAAALPLSVARSGILGSAIAFVVMFPSWPRAFRRRVLVVLSVGAVAFSFVVPGLLGTIRGLFLNANSDPSTGGRTADYEPVMQYFAQHRIFGTGMGTYMPELYRTLDNQYLAILVETGLVGLVATLVLLFGTMVVAAITRSRLAHDADRDLLQSAMAGVAVLTVSAGTFDMFAFPMAVGLLFRLIGLVGAGARIVANEGPLIPLPRRLGAGRMAVVAATTLIVAGSLSYAAESSKPEYRARASVVLEPPSPSVSGPFTGVGRSALVAWAVHEVMEDPATRRTLAAKSVSDYDVALGDGSLMPGTDRQGVGPLMTVEVRSQDPAAVDQGMSLVLSTLDARLVLLQDDVRVPPRERVVMTTLSTGDALPVFGRRSRFAAALLLIVVVVLGVGVAALRRLPRQSWRPVERAEGRPEPLGAPPTPGSAQPFMGARA